MWNNMSQYPMFGMGQWGGYGQQQKGYQPQFPQWNMMGNSQMGQHPQQQQQQMPQQQGNPYQDWYNKFQQGNQMGMHGLTNAEWDMRRQQGKPLPRSF